MISKPFNVMKPYVTPTIWIETSYLYEFYCVTKFVPYFNSLSLKILVSYPNMFIASCMWLLSINKIMIL